MASYPKIWTCIKQEPWWIQSSCAARGMITQLILDCKDGNDNGHVLYQSYGDFASKMSLSRNGAVTTLSRIIKVGTPIEIINETKPLHLFLPKYLRWQQMTAKEVAQYLCDSVSDMKPKSRQAKQSKAEQSIPEQSSTTQPQKKKIERLNEYIAKHPDRIKPKARDVLGIATGYEEHIDKWVRCAIKEMREYVIDHEDDSEYPLKERGVGGSIKNWFRIAKDIQDKKKAGKQSPYDKNGKHFEDAPRRSGGQSELISIADIMAKATGGK